MQQVLSASRPELIEVFTGLAPRTFREVLDELFEGFTDRLVADGAVVGDVLGDCRWQLSGYQYCKAHAGLPGLLCSRPFLEGHVRARVIALPSVRLAERCDVVGLACTADRRRVTGVRVHHDDRGAEHLLSADLVVDATGRGSRLPRWLDQLGYGRPEQDRVEIGLGYATRVLRVRPGALDGDLMILTAGTPTNPRSGFLFSIEGGRHMLLLAGILGDHPPTDPVGFEAFAASLPSPDIAAAVAGAEPLDEPVAFRFPVSVRHRYERLDRFPAGLLAIGDAVCSFNPVYGQGMTVAASEAMTLRRLLAAGRPPTPQRYFRAVAKVVDVPWDLAVGADLAFPKVAGRRTAKVRLVNAYLPRLHAAASGDAWLALAFLRVLGLLDRPQGLLRPDRVLRVLRHHLQQPHSGRSDTAAPTLTTSPRS